eukprot:746239-Hanusia_phi.AAC.18
MGCGVPESISPCWGPSITIKPARRGQGDGRTTQETRDAGPRRSVEVCWRGPGEAKGEGE